MQASKVLKSLGPIDIASVRRDPLLRWMIVAPIAMALLMRIAVPALTSALKPRANFDLTPYYPLVMGYFFVLLVPFLFGMVIGFLLLDERDDATLIALQVTPLSLNSYVIYRVAVPTLLSIVMVAISFPLTGLSDLGGPEWLLVALGSALLAPLFALFLAAFAANKVQGFALMKGLGAVLLLPMAAFFVRAPQQYLFGALPTYWPIKAYWLLDAGVGGSWPYLLIGIAFQLVLLALLLRRFNIMLHR